MANQKNNDYNLLIAILVIIGIIILAADFSGSSKTPHTSYPGDDDYYYEPDYDREPSYYRWYPGDYNSYHLKDLK